MESPGNIRGAGDKRGPLERHIRRLQDAIGLLTGRLDVVEPDLLGGGFVDLASNASGGNTAMTTSFQTAFTHSYTPPAGWNTYKIQGEVWASGAGFTSGDQFQIAAQITGGAAATGTVMTDDAAGTQRAAPARVEATGAAGAVDLLVRVRNNTAARGTTYLTATRIVAVRTS